jgi:L-aminopeptidase/D-esterase-like protein
VKTGPRNLITDIAGLAVGNAEDARIRTGVTVVVPKQPVLAAVDVRGGAPGTRETDALDPTCHLEEIHAIVLAGGSAFGLEAASAVQAALAASGVGFAVGPARIPIVPSAILFDLLNGGEKAWGATPPYGALGRAALAAAATDFRLGNSGAGYGAKAGRLKGGLGSASAVAEDGIVVGALVAANPRGSAVMPCGAFWAWPFEQAGEFGGRRPSFDGMPVGDEEDLLVARAPALPASTTIGVVATNAVLSKSEARRLAIMAQDGYARAIRPIHTPFDGDTVFALTTGEQEVVGDRRTLLGRIGSMAADCMARAVARGVYAAETVPPFQSWRDTYGGGAR